MRVVLDTNILISAFITRSGPPYRCLELWRRGRYTLVTSAWQIEELRGVTRRDELKTLLRRAEVGTFIRQLREKALVISELPKIDYSPDSDDNFIIAAAIAAQAQYVVSGDKGDVLTLGKLHGTRILSTHTFAALFK